MTGTRTTLLVIVLGAAWLAGCQGVYQDASYAPRVGGKAEAYARTWAVPGSPRPDLPPDRDGRKD